jgi:predicted AlkP superfamily pyrophosphatase or phosphodiesterase
MAFFCDKKGRFKRLIEKKGFEIYYTQLMEIDKTVHKYGKISEKTQEILEKTDKLLGKITEKFLKQNKDSEVIIWSDHGFADIKNYIDVKKILPKRKDYLYFIAGTTVSFWFENENIKKEIEKKISQIKLLKKLTPKIARKYNIPLKEKYGESIYFLEKGNYLFPNFYQKSENEKFKAMHGYPDNSEMDGFILLSSEQGKTGKKVKKNLKIKDIIRIL